jgi:hypothetical protein
MDVPNVFRTEYTLMDINDEGYVSALQRLGQMLRHSDR